jgi:dTDP-4-dehydrorhamnose reductase
MTTFLITGASGFLGVYLVESCQKRGVVHGLSRASHEMPRLSRLHTADITDQRSTLLAVEKTRPEIIIHAAALTDIDICESSPDKAWATNLMGTFNVACAAEKIGARLVYVSTDSVFDGSAGNYSENDLPRPINTYSASKAAGEAVVRTIAKDFVVVRTNFFGRNRNGVGFFNWLVQQIRGAREIPGFYDVIFSPLEVRNLSEAIAELASNPYIGTLHLGSRTPISKYEFACTVAKMMGRDPAKLVKRVSVDEAGLVARRPKNTSLDSSRALGLLQTKLQDVNNGIRKAVVDLNGP